MSKATKRKHVTKETLEDYYVPEDGEHIVKILGGRGNNLHEVEAADGTKYLVSMPTKFRKNVWVKRGDFVIVSPIEEGDKVKGEIVYILYKKQIKYLKSERLWPELFNEQQEDVKLNEITSLKSQNRLCDAEGNASTDDDDDNDLFVNPNHRPTYYYDDDETSSSEEEEEEEYPSGGEQHETNNEAGEGNDNVHGYDSIDLKTMSLSET